MYKKLKVCCVTGHRPKGFPWDYYDETFESQIEYRSLLQEAVEKRIKDGFNFFVCGGSLGVDIDFAETVLQFRKTYPDIKLEVAVPYPKQASAYPLAEKLRYEEILSKADEVTVICKTYTPWCMHKRNRYVVDKSDEVVAFWNVKKRGGTYRTIVYAENHKKEVDLILLPLLLREYKELEAELERLAEPLRILYQTRKNRNEVYGNKNDVR